MYIVPGNWVNNNQEDYQITPSTIAQLERGDSTAKPIPITDEWLKRFGFDDKEYTMELGYLTFSWASRIVSSGIRNGWRCDQYPHIKHVHQLQNLYHALFNKELEITKGK